MASPLSKLTRRMYKNMSLCQFRVQCLTGLQSEKMFWRTPDWMDSGQNKQIAHVAHSKPGSSSREIISWHKEKVTCLRTYTQKSPSPQIVETWGYGPTNGPDKWEQHFPAACGSSQSPIDIVTSQVQFDPVLDFHPLVINYHPEQTLSLENLGFTMRANCFENSKLRGGPVGNDEYGLIQFHLHWGNDNNSCGSEHTVNGRTYAAELHLVHWNCTHYLTFEEAMDKPNGLAVLGIFVEVGEKPHPGFVPIVNNIQHIVNKGQMVHLPEEYSTNTLLPKNTHRYWTYKGSLTTPPCYESVTWIVFEDIIQLSAYQLDAMRLMKCDELGHENLVSNIRPRRPLGQRVVRASFL